MFAGHGLVFQLVPGFGVALILPDELQTFRGDLVGGGRLRLLCCCNKDAVFSLVLATPLPLLGLFGSLGLLIIVWVDAGVPVILNELLALRGPGCRGIIVPSKQISPNVSSACHS